MYTRGVTRNWWKILLAAFIFLLLFYGASLLGNSLEAPECVLTTCKTGYEKALWRSRKSTSFLLHTREGRMQMIDYESKTKTEDYVKQLVDSWPEGTRAIAYKYLHIAYNITLSDIDHEIDKAFTVKPIPIIRTS